MTTQPATRTDIVTTASPVHRPRGGRVLFTSALVLLSVAGLAACSTSSAPPASPSTTPAASGAPTGTGGGGGFGGPAAFGLAAAITGNTIEVQDPTTGQVSVTYGTTTRFTQTSKESVSALVAGECVTAIGARSATGTSSGSSAAGGPTSFTATTITVTPATNGSCTGAGRFGSGTRPSGSARPSGAPTGARGGGFGAFASGKIISVSGATVLIQAINPTSGASSTDTVTTTAATTVTATVAATAAALKVGECVSATGPTSSTGAVAATRITLSTPGPTGCTAGFGRRGGAPSGGPSA
jgi:hypothetical protein